MAELLSLANVTAGYGDSVILEDVSLALDEGDSLALLGRNGVGKTTLLKCLMGVLQVASGSIALDGLEVSALAPYARVRLGMGYVPQGREIFPRLTVEENLMMGLAGRTNGAAKHIPGEIYEMFPVLKTMKNRRGGDLSGGQQQQLAIGRALVMRPKLLLLDEPTEGIQPSIVGEIQEVIDGLRQRGDVAILLVEQFLDFALTAASYYYIMEKGQIVAEGPTAQMSQTTVQQYLAV